MAFTKIPATNVSATPAVTTALYPELDSGPLGYIFLDLNTNKLRLVESQEGINPYIIFGKNTYLLSEGNTFYTQGGSYLFEKCADQAKILKEIRDLLENPFNKKHKRNDTHIIIRHAFIPTTYNTIVLENKKYTVITKEFYFITGDNINYDIYKADSNNMQDKKLFENLSLDKAAVEFEKLIIEISDKTKGAIFELCL